MDLFFKRDWVEGAGPAVEAARPLFAASFDVEPIPPSVLVVPAPDVAAGAVVVVDIDAGVEVAPGLLPRLKGDGAGAPVDAGPELAGVPPKLGNGRGAAVPLEAAGAVVVAAPDNAGVEAGVDPPSLGKLNPPVLAPVPDPAVLNKLVCAGPVDAGLGWFPPKENAGVETELRAG
jgi:hypothetical protein